MEKEIEKEETKEETLEENLEETSIRPQASFLLFEFLFRIYRRGRKKEKKLL